MYSFTRLATSAELKWQFYLHRLLLCSGVMMGSEIFNSAEANLTSQKLPCAMQVLIYTLLKLHSIKDDGVRCLASNYRLITVQLQIFVAQYFREFHD